VNLEIDADLRIARRFADMQVPLRVVAENVRNPKKLFKEENHPKKANQK
jgi:hypothetical protein